MSIEEKYHYFTNTAVDVMKQRITSEVPQSGMFSSLSVSFPIPESKNHGVIIIEPSFTKADNYRRLQVGAIRKELNYLSTSYIVHDTNENIIKYLEDNSCIEKLIQCFKFHSDKIDEDI